VQAQARSLDDLLQSQGEAALSRRIRSAAFTAAADVAGLQLSFGRTGDCYDNAAMETVWSTIKREVACIRGELVFDTRDEAKLFLFEHIEIFYNRQRHQTGPGSHDTGRIRRHLQPMNVENPCPRKRVKHRDR
jgi:transposase InsO family protein